MLLSMCQLLSIGLSYTGSRQNGNFSLTSSKFCVCSATPCSCLKMEKDKSDPSQNNFTDTILLIIS